MASPTSIERIGRYALVDRISSGGMAEVWRARIVGIRGFSKTVAVKRLHRHLLERPSFLRMFSDEAKIASRLLHPNIVQTFELGDDGGLPYIVMEYVAGRDLYMVLQRLAERGMRCPWDLATRVVLDVLDALRVAHDFRSLDGLPQEIVHRDISPRNILLSYGGEVKLTDFGVARARDREEHTEHGTIKGKVRYISPEGALGRTVDRRSDLYSLGVVLAEMLTMAPLRSGESDLAVLVAVRDGRHDRSRIASLPTPLQAILDRALEPDPERRFPSATAFAEALLGLAGTPAAPAEPAAVAAFMRHLFAREIAREDEIELEMDRRLAAESLSQEAAATPSSGTAAVNPPLVELPERAPDEEGSTAEVSLARLLHRLFENRVTGVLVLRREPLRKAIYLEDGQPVFVRSNLEDERFGELLIARGAVTRDELERALDYAGSCGLRLSEALLALSMVPPHQLFRHLAEQVRERILDLFSWSRLRFELYAGERSPEAAMPLNLRTHTLIHEGVHDRLPLAVVRRSLDPRREAAMARTAAELPSDLQLSGRQQRLLRSLDAGPATLASLVRSEGDEERILRLVYLLAEIDRLRFGPP